MFADLKEEIVKVIIKTAAMLKNINNKNTFFIITRSPFNIVNSAKMFFKNIPLSPSVKYATGKCMLS